MMNTNMRVNFENRTIVVTKAFMNKASVYGSDEYQDLMDALEKHVGFSVVVNKTSSKKNDRNKGLTFEKMEAYIRANDESGKLFEEFKALMDWEESYGTIKSWFMSAFPDFNEISTKKARRDEVLLKLQAKKEQDAIEAKKRLAEEREARILKAVETLKVAA